MKFGTYKTDTLVNNSSQHSIAASAWLSRDCHPGWQLVHFGRSATHPGRLVESAKRSHRCLKNNYGITEVWILETAQSWNYEVLLCNYFRNAWNYEIRNCDIAKLGNYEIKKLCNHDITQQWNLADYEIINCEFRNIMKLRTYDLRSL